MEKRTDEAIDKARRVEYYAVAAQLVMLLFLSANAQPQTITGSRADYRQPQFENLSPARLPGLLKGFGA